MKLPCRIVTLLSLLAVVGLCVGCASDPKAAAKAKADADEYVYVTTTGSRIPVRIKKSDLAAGKVAKGTLADAITAEEFKKSLRPSMGPKSN